MDIAPLTHAQAVIAAVRPNWSIRAVGLRAAYLAGMSTFEIIATVQPTWTVRQVGEKARELDNA